MPPPCWSEPESVNVVPLEEFNVTVEPLPAIMPEYVELELLV